MWKLAFKKTLQQLNFCISNFFRQLAWCGMLWEITKQLVGAMSTPGKLEHIACCILKHIAYGILHIIYWSISHIANWIFHIASMRNSHNLQQFYAAVKVGKTDIWGKFVCFSVEDFGFHKKVAARVPSTTCRQMQLQYSNTIIQKYTKSSDYFPVIQIPLFLWIIVQYVIPGIQLWYACLILFVKTRIAWNEHYWPSWRNSKQRCVSICENTSF